MKKAFEVMNAVRSIPNPDDTDDLQEEGDAFAVDDESLWQDLEEGEDSLGFHSRFRMGTEKS